MVTVRILGGLGNQLFQYAFGRHISLKKNTGLVLDYYHQIIRTDFDGENLTKITDVFDLPVQLYIGKTRKDLVNKYNLSYLDQLVERVCLKTTCVVTEDNYDCFLEKIRRRKNVYLAGYWQSEQYFATIKDIIRSDFKFKIERHVGNLNLYKRIVESNSVGLHVRGKDYKVHPWYSKCDIKYYMNAIDVISKTNPQLSFFIFTDDIENIHQNYKELLNFSEIVDVKTDFNSDTLDLLLMSKCKHNVIANSSFSWWGAWLNNNPDKIIISPKKWFNCSHCSSESLIPTGWHKI